MSGKAIHHIPILESKNDNFDNVINSQTPSLRVINQTNFKPSSSSADYVNVNDPLFHSFFDTRRDKKIVLTKTE